MRPITSTCGTAIPSTAEITLSLCLEPVQDRARSPGAVLLVVLELVPEVVVLVDVVGVVDPILDDDAVGDRAAEGHLLDRVEGDGPEPWV